MISDSADTLTALRLAGIEGKGVKTPEELEEAANKCLETDVAILLFTSTLAEKSRSFVDSLKERSFPLVVEIPDREHCGEKYDSLTSYVRDAMGIKL